MWFFIKTNSDDEWGYPWGSTPGLLVVEISLFDLFYLLLVVASLAS